MKVAMAFGSGVSIGERGGLFGCFRSLRLLLLILVSCSPAAADPSDFYFNVSALVYGSEETPSTAGLNG